MTLRNAVLAIGIAPAALFLGACERGTEGLMPAPGNTDPIVFDDTFGASVDFQAFLGSKLDAVTIDASEWYSGTASLKVTVPGPGATDGTFAGGAFTTSPARDLSGYNALTFWAKASMDATLDVAGLGNDNTGASRYEAKRNGIPLTTSWTRHVIPIPLPERLSSERGLFFFAEGYEQDMGYTIWLDDVRFENVPGISNPRPSMPTQTLVSFVGANVTVEGARTIFDVGGSDQTIFHQAGYFDFSSSDESVLLVNGEDLDVVGPGSAILTASLGEVGADGDVTVNAANAPTEAAPTPTIAAADVISLFSNAYSDVTVDTWLTDWSQPSGRVGVLDFKVAGDDVKVYTNLDFAGIEFTSQTLDVSAMTYFHMDIWVSAGTTVFKVKLVDFGADGAYGGGDDREHEITINTLSSPPIATEIWFGLEIPMTAFTGLTTRGHLAQLIIASQEKTVFIDNVYFHK